MQKGRGVVVNSVSVEGGSFSVSGIPEPRLLVQRLGRRLGSTSLGDTIVSGSWSPQDADLSTNARELLVVERGLHHFAPQLIDSTVAVFVDNSTAIAYLRKQGGTHSPLLNSTQRIIRWTESVPLVLTPQFIRGRNNVLEDSPSRPNQIQGSEWTLKQDVFLDLRRRWPVMVNLFATSLNHQCSLFFALPRSECLGDGCFSSELGRLSGVCLSTLVPDTPGSEETPLIF